MTIDSYTNLQTAGANWLHRTDLTDRIPEFIALAEAKMNRLLRVAESEQSAVLAATEYVALPTGFTKARRLRRFDGYNYEDMQFVSLVPSLSNGAQGTPQVASIQGSNMVIRPPPDTSNTPWTFALDYYAKFTPLSATNPSNWILASHPDAYLYGMLAHSAPFLGTDSRLAVWAQLFLDALDDINTADARKRFDTIQMRTDFPNRRVGRYNVFSDSSA